MANESTDPQAPEIQLKTSATVTLADVQSVVEELADGDPGAIGAGKIREALGRGSMNTIQKLLIGLRDAKRAAEMLPEVEEGTEPMPAHVRAQIKETVAQIEAVMSGAWVTGFSLAENRVRARYDVATTERDHWRAKAEEAALELEARCLDIDAKDAELVAMAEALQKAVLEAGEEKGRLEAQIEEKGREIERQAAEAEAVAVKHADQVKDMQHAADVAALKWDVERQTLRGLNSELQDKLRGVELERDKILERVERIQAEADARVARATEERDSARKGEMDARSRVRDMERQTIKYRDEILELEKREQRALDTGKALEEELAKARAEIEALKAAAAPKKGKTPPKA